MRKMPSWYQCRGFWKTYWKKPWRLIELNVSLHLPARSSHNQNYQGINPSLILPAHYSNEGFTLDLVKYGLRLWEWEIVEVDDYIGGMGTAAAIGLPIDQVRSPTFCINEASRLRLPSYNLQLSDDLMMGCSLSASKGRITTQRGAVV